MIRFLILYPPPPDIDAFEQHYRDVHIPLAMKLAELRSYNVARNPRPVRGEEPCYLVAELEWDDMASLQKDFASAEGRATSQDMEGLEKLCPGIRSMIYEPSSV
jgi:uncharacterized protein (TIGR02118 family)